MAYRMLRAMTLVALGVIAVGCGSGPGVATAVEDDSGIPESPEAPPASADDAPPANPDAPPGSGSEPGGGPGTPGGAEGLCRQICDSLGDANCAETGNDIPLNAIVAAACEQNCLVTGQNQACRSEITDVLGCISRVEGLCTDQVSEDACRKELDAVEACDEANEPSNPEPNACAGIADLCEACRCAAGANAQIACATLCM